MELVKQLLCFRSAISAAVRWSQFVQAMVHSCLNMSDMLMALVMAGSCWKIRVQ
jgi:hypothetical protein